MENQEGFRLALANLLRKKMAATIHRGTGIVAAEEIVEEECNAFMRMTGAVQVADLQALELRIHNKLDELGVAKRPHIKLDEWTVLFKYQNGVAEEAAKRKAEALAKQREDMRIHLAAQVEIVHAKKAEEREEVKRYAKVLAADQAQWKAEEEAKRAERAEAVVRLRIDRDAQLAAKSARHDAEEKQRRRELEDAKKAMLMEHAARTREEQARVARERAAAAGFLESNAAILEMKAAQKKAEGEESLRMQFEYTERLRLQDEAREAHLEEMKQKQLRAERAGNAVGPYKRYLDDSIIEKNFQIREAEQEKRAAVAKTKVVALREDLKVGLQKQISAKVVAKQALVEKDMAMVATILEGAKIAQYVENEKVMHEKAQAAKARQELEDQIQMNAEMKKKTLMSDTEKQINMKTLAKIPDSTIPMPPRGVVTYRQVPVSRAAPKK